MHTRQHQPAPVRLVRASHALLVAAAISLAACGGSVAEGRVVTGHPRGAVDTPAVAVRSAAESCAALAPEDPYAPPDDSLDAALGACRAAAREAPDDTASLFRLGLAALQAHRGEEALAAFQRADTLGHCAAASFVGDHYWYAEHDEHAEAYYRKAYDRCGDERAAREILVPERFAMSDHADDLAALIRSDVGRLNARRFLTASYVAGVYDTFQEQYLGAQFDLCWTTKLYRGADVKLSLLAAERGNATNPLEAYAYEKAMPLAFRLLRPDLGWTNGLADYRDAARQAGHADALRVVNSSSCDALLPHQLMRGVVAYAGASRSFADVLRTELPQVRSLDDLARLAR